MIRATLQRYRSRTFRRSFILILIAEALTIFGAWLALDLNVNRWMHGKATRLVPISQQAASAYDWSLIDKVPRGKQSPLFERYQKELDALSKRYFLRDEGAFYVAVVDRGEEYYVLSADPVPMDDGGTANKPELEAYSTHKSSYSPIPISDDSGTYLAAYTPILRDGKVIGLVAVEYDSAPLSDFQDVVRTAFWFSVIPALLISVVVASILASLFVEPMEIFRTIEETAQSQRARSLEGAEDDLWNRLTPREKEVAELARRGLQIKEMADELSVSPETVKKHLKNIRVDTGWNLRELAVEAQARRTASLPS
jgi:DNA-binding CsgD family transcriptional regulator